MDNMEEQEDSRTSVVGRKRNFGDVQEGLRNSLPEEDEQRAKRVKEAKNSSEPLVDDGFILDASSPGPSTMTTPPGASTQPATARSVPGSWNKSVQRGVRTSFGTRQPKAQPKPVSTLLDFSANSPEGQDFNVLHLDHEMGGKEAQVAIPQEVQISSRDEGKDLTMQHGLDLEEEGEFLLSRDARDTREVSEDSGSGHAAIGYVDDAEKKNFSDADAGDGDDGGSVDDAEEAEPASPSHAPEQRLARVPDPSGKALSHPEYPAEPPGKSVQPKTEKQKRADNLEIFQNLTKDAEAMFTHNGPPLSNHDAVKASVASGHTFFPYTSLPQNSTHITKNVSYVISRVLKDGNPVDIRHLTIELFAESFQQENRGKPLNAKVLSAAFRVLQKNSYSRLAIRLGNRYGSEKEKMMFKEQAKQLAIKFNNQVADLAPSVPITEMAEEVTLNQANVDIDLADIGHAEKDDFFIDEADVNGADVTRAVIYQTDVDDLQRVFQEKYFPAVQDRKQPYHCLACGQTTHTTQDCSCLTCAQCGGDDHPQSSCAQNRRCSKCRERGHAAAACPEKLLRSGAEGIQCDLCGSTQHIELHCHTIWRTYNPKPEEIRLVSSIPVHCYVCGTTGHYGPDCGLYSGEPLRTGGKTWSMINLTKFLDPSSADRAMSADVDYSVGEKISRQMRIKGKSNNPINVEDSDDEDVTFIHAKVNGPRSHGHIKIASPARFGQAPHGPRYAHEPVLATSTRIAPNHEYRRNGPARSESTRHGRERTLSPPPRYEMGMSQNNYRQDGLGQNSYRPPPAESRYDDLAPPHQPSFSTRPSRNRRGRRGESRPPRGATGQARGGGAQNAQNIQNGGSISKKKKKKPVRGGAARRGG